MDNEYQDIRLGKGIMTKYRGYNITQEYDLDYYATCEDADYDWQGEEDGYVQCGGKPSHSGHTVEEVKAEIDIWYDEMIEETGRQAGIIK